MKALATAMRDNAGTAVTYRRGADALSLTAVRGRSEFEVVDPSGATFHVQTVDWIFRAQDLVIDGKRVEPERGDLIEVEDEDGFRRTYSLCETGGIQSYQLDPLRTSVRCRTKLREKGDAS